MRLLVRQITDVLRRHEVIDAATAAALHAVGRSPTLPDVMRAWFELQPAMDIEMLDEVLGWAARPYLQRTAEVLQQRVSLDRWMRRVCPVCAAEPEFSVITPSGERQLVCGRCHVRWALRRDRLPVLRQRRSHAHQVDGDAGRHVSRDDLLAVRALHQGARRAQSDAAATALC